ncbi:aminotransferase class V-fold PLP-dependent enzyme [Clostridium cellulovorans]|uniref:cysteine desulfurase n=1 Tax=Clostridium cellulovorans (strain ATCC 35296 / DSM 3052 / OCM 3 / 743B) TaxID=573061 RepID=D9SPC6_CLOC7|nr:aminotransferase class V-fold PLP-dependent enzyme [Clostridium cellulovorans]ADL54028.1 cysteine desulfurase family protein [Clostridium cellulovorans 743B]
MDIYFDNSSTTFPKPPTVIEAVNNFITSIGGNPSRGANSTSLNASRLVYDCRVELSNFFDFNLPSNVIFTHNITYALNMLIKGIVKDGWHVITSSMDHNSTLRTLFSLNLEDTIELSILQTDETGLLDLDVFENAIKHNTKLVVLSHASNIIGSIQPLKTIGDICKKYNIYFIIDTAQSAGIIPISFKEFNCDALAFTGHKSLFGIQGIGGFLISEELSKECSSIFTGGTGSSSSELTHPSILPDKYEPGTLNTPGIVSLLEGIRFINNISLQKIHTKDLELSETFLKGMSNLKNYKIYRSPTISESTPTISFTHNTINNEELAFLLSNEFNISCRSGLHCAPLAHKTIGTYPNGTIRFSFSYFNTTEEINESLSILEYLDKKGV